MIQWEKKLENDVTILNGKVIITQLIMAQKAFDRGLAIAESELERDGVIQRFEFTYEILWKTLKKVFDFKGIKINNPRDIFRQSGKDGLVDDPKFWFEVIKKRNLTTHIYSENYSKEIFEFLPQFQTELEKVIIYIRAL